MYVKNQNKHKILPWACLQKFAMHQFSDYNLINEKAACLLAQQMKMKYIHGQSTNMIFQVQIQNPSTKPPSRLLNKFVQGLNTKPHAWLLIR